MRGLLVWLSVVGLVGTAFGQVIPHPQDAAIRSMQFVDENEGWAVGDDGLVLHTIDAGKTWERQASGTFASLRSVHFLTPYSGWAVGRIELPEGVTAGVVLATSDGGLKWRVVNRNSIPGLNLVKFFGEQIGLAAGDGSDANPSGMYVTLDAGKSWRCVPGTRHATWLAGDFSDPETGVLAGTWNRLAPVREGVMGMADVDSLGGRNVKSLKLNGAGAVAVGQGALIMLSRDTAGVKWGFADLQLTSNRKLPQELRASIDFHAVAVRGKHIWAVGRPGSVVFHSADEGQTWEIQKTGQPLPLHSIEFADEKHGWAAGDMGTILATQDGGKSWTVQRQGGMRTAALFVHAFGKNVPLDAVAALGGDEGYYVATLGILSADPLSLTRRYDSDAERIAATMKTADPRRTTDGERMNSTMRLTGGVAGEQLWQFPMAGFQDGLDAQTLLDGWEKRHGEKAPVALLRQMVLALRMWRPDVVVTDGQPDETSKLVAAVLRKAFEAAADPEAFPEQITTLGLAPWAGRKLLATLDKADPTAVNVDVALPRPRLGDSARDFALPAYRLWSETARKVPGYRLTATRLEDTTGQLKFFDGIALAPGGAARRELVPLTDKDEAKHAELAKALEERRNVQAVIDGHAGSLAKPEQALAQLLDAVKKLPANDAGKALYCAGTGFVHNGQWFMAREAYLLLLDRYPAHPLTLDAARWLVRFQASSEARRRQQLGQFVELTDTSFIVKNRPQPPAGLPSKKANGKDNTLPTTDVVQATYRETADAFLDARKWYRGALEMEASLAAHGDLFARDVPLNLCYAAARRQLGKGEEAQRWLMKYIAETMPPVSNANAARGADPWRENVLLESWLLNRGGNPVPPKPVTACRRTAERPHLDGKLDDACWTQATPMSLGTLSGELGHEFGCKEAIERAYKDQTTGKTNATEMQKALADGTRAMLSFDDEYLYIAVVCKHPEGLKKDKLDTRTHDMNLKAHDRVSIMIDLDRDYQTYYNLQVDQRGAVADDCWGDASWNPKWFVAVQPDATGWTAEIAIPLSELTGETVTLGKMWAVNVVRTVPGRGVQAWSGPAGAIPRPEGMGLMSFIGEAKR